jgi:hypothetical protein
MTETTDEDAAPGSTSLIFKRLSGITGTDLRLFIERNKILGVKSRWKTPKPAELVGLANAISALRERVTAGTDASMSPEQLLINQRKEEVRKALATLVRVLPDMQSDISNLGDVLVASDFMFVARCLRQLNALQNAVNEAWDYNWLIPRQELFIRIVADGNWATKHSDGFSVPPLSCDREIHDWKHFAAFLADKFRDVVQASNPSSPRLTNGGGSPNAVMLFLAAVIPHITGQTPTADAVRKHLKRRPAGDKPK